jgi:lysophospholipase L1-like esterase
MRSIAVGVLLLAGSPRTPPPTQVGYPNSMAALGDSITRAFNTGVLPFADEVRNSWSTGTSESVGSHYLRILAQEPEALGRNHNEARSGARVDDLLAQVRAANEDTVAYVTILIGANDACTTSVDAMTSVSAFRDAFKEAMRRLSAGSPRTRVFVASIPDVYRLWTLLRDSFWARLAWRVLDVCRSLLEDPRSNDRDDVRRRREVRRRIRGFNEQLEEVCARYIHCRFDDNALFADPFTSADVSSRDFFHPSIEGQERLSRVAWGATFDFSDRAPPTSTATITRSDAGALVAVEATDDVGVAGIEYRLDAGPFRRYTRALSIPAGTELRYRAVDVNGNVEATHVLIG